MCFGGGGGSSSTPYAAPINPDPYSSPSQVINVKPGAAAAAANASPSAMAAATPADVTGNKATSKQYTFLGS